ncbi:hypothetical protein ABW19_dt0207455 [Dactylella cylindrospora]|nr:hypothetical protein ABW19_dt0207455 [Dactylella cylindrospora]
MSHYRRTSGDRDQDNQFQLEYYHHDSSYSSSPANHKPSRGRNSEQGHAHYTSLHAPPERLQWQLSEPPQHQQEVDLEYQLPRDTSQYRQEEQTSQPGSFEDSPSRRFPDFPANQFHSFESEFSDMQSPADILHHAHTPESEPEPSRHNDQNIDPRLSEQSEPAERKHRKRRAIPTPCPICGDILAHNNNLKRHILTRHPQKEYTTETCNDCGMTFGTHRAKENLRTHKNSGRCTAVRGQDQGYYEYTE